MDVPVKNVAINSTGNIDALNLIRTGSTYVTRQGRKVEMKSIRVVANIVPIAGRTATSDYGRIVLVYDRQPNGALPAVAEVLQTTDQAANNTTTSFSGINLNNRDRFIILRDEHVYLTPNVITAGGQPSANQFIDPLSKTWRFDWYVKLKNLVTQYKADSAPAVIGDIATGSLLLLTLGFNAAGSEAYQLSYESRLRFVDI